MPDWKEIVRDRIAGLQLKGAAEPDLVEELAQPLEERYHEYCSAGETEEEAYLKTVSELYDDMQALRAESKRIQKLPKHDAVPSGDAKLASSWKVFGGTFAMRFAACAKALCSCCSCYLAARWASRVDPLTALREG